MISFQRQRKRRGERDSKSEKAREGECVLSKNGRTKKMIVITTN